MTAKALGFLITGMLVSWLTSCGSDDDNEAASATDGSTTRGGSDNSGGSAGENGGTSTSAGGSHASGSGGSANAGSGGESSAGGSTSGSGGSANTGSASGGSAGATDAGVSSASGGGGSGGSAAEGGAAGAGTEDVFDVEYELASDVDPAAPGTIGIVTFAIDAPALVNAEIQFGLDTSYGMSAPVDLEAGDYRTLLLGMKPDHVYHFRIVATDEEEGTYTSADYVIETGPPTDLVSLDSFTVLDDTHREPGFMVTSFFEGDISVTFIIDADGDIVWWYGRRSMRAAMSADGKNLWMVAQGFNGYPVERLSMDTLDSELYRDAVGSHDITAVSGDLMAFLEYGEDDCDSIVEIDPSGETREIFESEGIVPPDGCHSNALRYSASEDVYTFSDRKSDIYVINREGGIEWRLSEIVEGGNASWGAQQHGHQLLDDSIIFFANQGGEDTEAGHASAVFEYTLDGTQIMSFDDGHYTLYVGDVQRLPGGNTLVTYSQAGVIEEVDPDGNVVLRIEAPSSFGYVSWRPTLYGPPSEIGL